MDHPQKNRTIILISLLTIGCCAVVMFGWVCNISSLQSLIPGMVAMRFNAALCFGLLGGALLFSQFNTNKFGNWWFISFTALTLIIALITLSQDIFHYNSGIDQFFVFDNTARSATIPFPGRMASNAAANFCFLGVGFLLLSGKAKLNYRAAQYLFHIVTILSGVAIIGYIYGVALFNTLFLITSMALSTAILFFMLSVSASLLMPWFGFAGLFTGNRIGNQMAKRLFSLIMLMVIIFGSLKGETQSTRLFASTDIGLSVLAIGFLMATLLIIWHTAKWLNKIDTERHLAEAKVIQMNAELEKRVTERTIEYQKSEERYHELIDQASDAIYVIDNDRNFIDVNVSMSQLSGYSKEELLQMNVKDILDPIELKNHPLPMLTTYVGQPPIERHFVRKNGEQFVAEVNVKVFPDNRIMVVARDVTYRNKMQDEIREAELKFRTIAEKSMVGVYIVQDGKFTYVNPRFAHIFGYEPEELINTLPLDVIIYDTHREITNEHVRRRMAGEVESVHYETMGKKKDGTRNCVEFYGSRTIIGGLPTIIGSMIDVTERKDAEEELRSSEQKYKLLFESNPMPMWMIAKDDLTIIAVNDAAAEHYGYEKDELINMSVKILRPEEDAEQQMEGYQKNLNGPASVVRHLKKDGSIMYIQIIAHDIIFEGRPVRLSLTNDVTEKLKAEESLQKSEANLQAILSTTDTAYALFDRDLKALSFNPKATQFIKDQYGYVPESNRDLSDYFPHDKYPQLYKFVTKVFNGENINFEVNIPQADGGIFWYYVRLFPINNDDKDIIGILMALYDITERKNAEQDLKSAYKRIQSHINSIKDMAWKQSHLIRSPLANLKGLTEMLKNDSDPQILNHIQAELHRMDDIIIEMANDVSSQD